MKNDELKAKSFVAGAACQAPNVSWIVTWIVASVLFFTLLAVVEPIWRSLGYRPSAVDSPALRKFWYECAVSGGSRTMVFIGASRIQAGISLTAMRQRLPHYRVVQLGQFSDGRPIGVLQSLANDDRFSGIVVCDTLEPFLFRAYWGDQRRPYGHHAPISELGESYASAYVRDLLAVANTKTGIFAASKLFLKQGKAARPDYVRMHADRSIELDFRLVDDLERLREMSLASFRMRYDALVNPAPVELDRDLKEINLAVSRIQDRGGQVVFLRMPSSGARLELEEEYHPKAKYWDRFAAISSGICIHWSELRNALEWKCPDDSHLDCSEAVAFTDALVDELARRQSIEF